MRAKKEHLLTAFREDHVVLGQGFHELAGCLRGNDLAGGRVAADRLDGQAGAHAAFEEEGFSPALVPLPGESDVPRICVVQRRGFEAGGRLRPLLPVAGVDGKLREGLLRQVEEMEKHVAECGEPIEPMGPSPSIEQETLYQRRGPWRHKALSCSQDAGPRARQEDSRPPP